MEQAPKDYAKFGTKFDWENDSQDTNKTELVVPAGILDGLEDANAQNGTELAGDEEHARRILKLMREDMITDKLTVEKALTQEDFSL